MNKRGFASRPEDQKPAFLEEVTKLYLEDDEKKYFGNMISGILKTEFSLFCF